MIQMLLLVMFGLACCAYTLFAHISFVATVFEPQPCNHVQDNELGEIRWMT